MTWSKTFKVQTGMMTFYASAYDWDGRMRHHGSSSEVNVQIGSNTSVMINVSPIEYLSASITVSGIPSWGEEFRGVFVGLVDPMSEFDFYADIIEEFAGSGFDEYELERAAGNAFIASGEGQIDGSTGKVFLTNWERTRPWLGTGEYAVFVMLQTWDDMFIPFFFDDSLEDYVPFLGNVTLTSPYFSDSVSLGAIGKYTSFLELVFSGIAIKVEVSGIDTTEIDTDYTGDEWELVVAVFPPDVDPFDETGQLIEGAEPIAMGFTGITGGLDQSGTVMLFVEDHGYSDFPTPWLGDAGTYGAYILVAEPWNYGNDVMYIAGTITGEGFIPERFVLNVSGEQGQTIPISVTSFDFVYFETPNDLVLGHAYNWLEFEYRDDHVFVGLYQQDEYHHDYIPDRPRLAFDLNEVLEYDAEIPVGEYTYDSQGTRETGTFIFPEIIGYHDCDGYHDENDNFHCEISWISYLATTDEFVVPSDYDVDHIGKVDIIVGGTIVVSMDALSGEYTFEWSFLTDDERVLEGSYSGPVDSRWENTQ